MGFPAKETPPIKFEEITYPEVDYRTLRKNYACEQVVIPYKPAEAPAWSKHQQSLAPRPARFEKLQRWGDRADALQKVAQWAVVAAGAATFAPAVMHLVH